MTSLQKGFFIAETAEYAEHYLKKISALSAFSAMSFCSGLNFIDLRFFKVTVTTPIRYIGSKKAIRQSPFPFVPEKR